MGGDHGVIFNFFNAFSPVTSMIYDVLLGNVVTSDVRTILTKGLDSAVDKEDENPVSPCSENLMSRGLFQLDTDSLGDKLQSLEARATKLSADYDLLMERVGMLEQHGLQNTELVEKEKRLVVLLELLMRDDVRANVINDYAIAFFRLVLLKMRQQGHDFDDLQQLSKALDEDDVGFVFRRILRDLEFPECELSSVITLLEAIKHRKWPSPDTSQVQTSSPAGDAQISSALIYLRAQNELDPQVNASLRRAICLAHESVLSDTAVCEVTPDTNHNDNATGVMAPACGRACMISEDDLESILRGRRLLEAIENQKRQCCCFNMDAMLQPRGEAFGARGVGTNTRDVLYGCRGFQGKPHDEACLEKEDEEEDGEEEMGARHPNVRPVRLTAGRARGLAVDSWDATTSVGDVIGHVLEGGARLLSVNLAEVETRVDAKANGDKAAEGSARIPATYRTSEDGRDQSEVETTLERTDFQDGGMSQIKEKEKEKEEEKDEEEEKEVEEEEAAEQEDVSEELALSEEEEGDQNTACANVNTCPAAHYSRLLEHQHLNAAAEFSTWQFVFDLFDDEEGNDNRYRQVEDPHQNPPSLSTAPTSSASRDKEDTCDCYLS